MSVEPIQASAVVAETQAQQLRTLMDALGVKAGDTVAAKVTAQVSPTVARLDINGMPLDVRTPQPLPVGATLTFAVERQGQNLKLLLSDLPRSPPPPQGPQAPPPAGAPPLAQGPVPRTVTLPSVPLPTAPLSANPTPAAGPATSGNPAGPVANAAPPAAPAPPLAISSAIPAQTAASPASPGAPATPQAPASASPSQPATRPPAAPSAVPTAAPVLSSPASPTVAPPPQAIAAALVGMVARGLLAQDTPEAPAIPPDEPTSPRGEAPKAAEPISPAARQAPRDAPGPVLREAMRQAAGKQESLGGLFADLAALTARTPAPTLRALPEPVLRAVANVLGFRLPAEAAATPQGIAQAVERSGTFLEARLAALPPGSPPPPDLKAALGQLKAALAGWTATPPEPAETAPSTPTRPTPDQPAKPVQPQADRPASDRPPLRGALPQGQPPAAPSLTRDATPADIARILTERTEAALARVTLVQAASLPEVRDLPRADAPLQTSVEIPLRLGAETAMLQAQILREPDEEPARAKSKTAKAGTWSMRFSLEAEPIGPLHALVRWQAGRVAVQLWAERDATAAALDAARGTLADALEASAFTVEQLTIAAGRPADPREAPRREPRLDRLS